MKIAASLLFLLALAGCTATDEQRTREEAKQTGAVLKKDAKEALHEARIGTEKAGKEIDKGLQETREKVRKAINAPPDRK
ncbi:MAG: hypothetical protein M3N54_11005 [Acidobacteriota bacterium]|nr:hypothetical protein [Acidobacteriota bacterium]